MREERCPDVSVKENEMPQDCEHKPECPAKVSRWVCAQRTAYEDCVKRGLLERHLVERLLAKYGTVMTPASRVVRGEPAPSVLQSELFGRKS